MSSLVEFAQLGPFHSKDKNLQLSSLMLETAIAGVVGAVVLPLLGRFVARGWGKPALYAAGALVGVTGIVIPTAWFTLLGCVLWKKKHQTPVEPAEIPYQKIAPQTPKKMSVSSAGKPDDLVTKEPIRASTIALPEQVPAVEDEAANVSDQAIEGLWKVGTALARPLNAIEAKEEWEQLKKYIEGLNEDDAVLLDVKVAGKDFTLRQAIAILNEQNGNILPAEVSAVLISLWLQLRQEPDSLYVDRMGTVHSVMANWSKPSTMRRIRHFGLSDEVRQKERSDNRDWNTRIELVKAALSRSSRIELLRRTVGFFHQPEEVEGVFGTGALDSPTAFKAKCCEGKDAAQFSLQFEVGAVGEQRDRTIRLVQEFLGKETGFPASDFIVRQEGDSRTVTLMLERSHETIPDAYPEMLSCAESLCSDFWGSNPDEFFANLSPKGRDVLFSLEVNLKESGYSSTQTDHWFSGKSRAERWNQRNKETLERSRKYFDESGFHLQAVKAEVSEKNRRARFTFQFDLAKRREERLERLEIAKTLFNESPSLESVFGVADVVSCEADVKDKKEEAEFVLRVNLPNETADRESVIFNAKQALSEKTGIQASDWKVRDEENSVVLSAYTPLSPTRDQREKVESVAKILVRRDANFPKFALGGRTKIEGDSLLVEIDATSGSVETLGAYYVDYLAGKRDASEKLGLALYKLGRGFYYTEPSEAIQRAARNQRVHIN